MNETKVSSSGHDSDIAIIGMAGRFPGAKNVDEVLAQPARRRRVASRSSPTRSCWRPGVDPELLHRSQLRQSRRRPGRHRPVRRRLLRLHAARSRDHGPAAPPVPGVRLGGARGRRATTRKTLGARSASSPARAQHIPAEQPAAAPASCIEAVGGYRGSIWQRQGLPAPPASPTS